VTAATDLRLLVLERDEFLRVVTGHADVHARADRVAVGYAEDIGMAD
jgi:hypothetical protein